MTNLPPGLGTPVPLRDLLPCMASHDYEDLVYFQDLDVEPVRPDTMTCVVPDIPEELDGWHRRGFRGAMFASDVQNFIEQLTVELGRSPDPDTLCERFLREFADVL